MKFMISKEQHDLIWEVMESYKNNTVEAINFFSNSIKPTGYHSERYTSIVELPVYVFAAVIEQPDMVIVADSIEAYWGDLPSSRYAAALLDFLKHFQAFGRSDIYEHPVTTTPTEPQLWDFILGLHAAGFHIVNSIGAYPPMGLEEYTALLHRKVTQYFSDGQVISYVNTEPDTGSAEVSELPRGE